MDAIGLLVASFEDLHRALREGMADAANDYWRQPGEGLNHPGFLFWHIARDEDDVVSYVARQPQLWQSAGWAARFEMDEKEQGTGFEPANLGEFRYDRALFREYAEAAWARTGPLLETLSPARLDEVAWPGSDWNVATHLVEGCLGHSWGHLGEVRAVLGLRGWRYRE